MVKEGSGDRLWVLFPKCRVAFQIFPCHHFTCTGTRVPLSAEGSMAPQSDLVAGQWLHKSS